MPVATDEAECSTDAVAVIPAGDRVASKGLAAKLETFPSHTCFCMQSGSAINVTSMHTSTDARRAM